MPIFDEEFLEDAFEDFYGPIMRETKKKVREFKKEHERDQHKFDMANRIEDAFYRLALYEHYTEKGKTLDRLVAGEMLKDDIAEILRLQSKIIAMRNPKQYSVSDEEVEKARNYPIEELAQLKGDFGCCPFHGDKNPSMHKLDNRVHCFSCHKTWDTIDYVRELEQLQFGEAVRWINKQSI